MDNPELEARFVDVFNNLLQHKPLIYHMTNMVAINGQAHLALAIGASPVIALSRRSC